MSLNIQGKLFYNLTWVIGILVGYCFAFGYLLIRNYVIGFDKELYFVEIVIIPFLLGIGFMLGTYAFLFILFLNGFISHKEIIKLLVNSKIPEQWEKEEIIKNTEKKIGKEIIITRLFGWLLIIYSSISGFLMLKMGAELDILFLFTFKYLLIPIFIICTITSLKFKHIFISCLDNKIFCYLKSSFIFSIIVTLLSMGYVSYFNTIIQPQEDIYYSGIVEKKLTTRKGKYLIKINGSEKEFLISEEEYNKIKLGQLYKIKMKKGGLGIVYKINP